MSTNHSIKCDRASEGENQHGNDPPRPSPVHGDVWRILVLQHIITRDRVFFVSGHVKSKKVIRRYLVGYSFGFYHTEAVIFLRNSQIRKYAEDGGEDFLSFFCSRLFFCVFVPADFVFVG